MATRSSFTRVSGGVITSAWANSLRDHLVPYSGAADGTTEGMLSVNTATDTVRVGNGTTTVQYGTYSNAGLSVWSEVGASTQGTSIAFNETDTFFTRFGPIVIGSGFLTCAPMSPGVAGNPIIIATNLPLPLRGTPIGTFQWHEVGVTLHRGVLFIDTSGRLAMGITNSPFALGTAPSFAADTGDTVEVSFAYIAASAV
jgi:hypothetical protein